MKFHQDMMDHFHLHFQKKLFYNYSGLSFPFSKNSVTISQIQQRNSLRNRSFDLQIHTFPIQSPHCILMMPILSFGADCYTFCIQTLHRNAGVGFEFDQAACSDGPRNFWWFWGSSWERCHKNCCSWWNCSSSDQLCDKLRKILVWVSHCRFIFS